MKDKKLIEKVWMFVASHRDMINSIEDPSIGIPDMEWSKRIENDIVEYLAEYYDEHVILS